MYKSVFRDEFISNFCYGRSKDQRVVQGQIERKLANTPRHSGYSVLANVSNLNRTAIDPDLSFPIWTFEISLKLNFIPHRNMYRLHFSCH